MTNESINLLTLTGLSIGYLGVIFAFGFSKLFPSQKIALFVRKPEKRIPFFDFVKGIAILAIIVIHTSFFMAAFQDKFSIPFFEWSTHIDRVMRFAIPVFLISCGALLTLKDLKRETLKEFYLTKFQRIFIPYIILSSLATALYSSNIQNPFQYIVISIRDIFTGQALVPYWFLPLLIQLYILFPFFWYLFLVKKIKPSLILFLSFLFSLGCYLLFIRYEGWHLIFGNSFFGSFLFFFVLGIVLKPLLLTENRLWLKRINFPFFTLLIIIFYLAISMANPLETYYNLRFIYGPIVFLLLFYFYPQLSHFKIVGFFQKIGENSLYFYLIHFFILSFLAKLIIFFNLFYINPYFLYIGLFTTGFLITSLLSFLTSKLYNFLCQAYSSYVSLTNN